MKKKIYIQFICLFLFIIFTETGFTQTEVNTSFAAAMNNVFAYLDKTKVPYGILRDYGMEFTNIENYNGTAALADSNYADATSFWDVYNTLAMSRISTAASGFAVPDTIANQWYRARQPGQITLSGLYFKYARFKDNATNSLVITNGQIYDKYVNGVWQNPYTNEQIFILSPSIAYCRNTSFQILLPNNLWFSNSAGQVSSINIDVSDGAGYKILTKGQPLPVNYTDTGYKVWTYKLMLTNGTIYYAHSQIHITAFAGASQLNGKTPGTSGPTEVINATQPYNGIYGSGYMTISYANADHILRKPLIVAEGYDPTSIINPDDIYGNENLNTFLANVDNSNSLSLYQLLHSSNQQYDIVYVDWGNGVDYIQRNALLLEAVIQEVNRRKALAGSTQPNVVLGRSMGGVALRWALKDMENKGIVHQTRLFVSWDAPQQGANVPEGYQHLARHASSLYIQTGLTGFLFNSIYYASTGTDMNRVLNLADEPASLQLLINHVNSNNVIDNTAHNSWQAELQNLGYPQGNGGIAFSQVAVSNGSECATSQPFGAGANLLTIYGKANTRFWGDILGSIGLPIIANILNMPPLMLSILPGRNDFFFDLAVNAQADGASNQVYRAKLTYTKKIIWLIPVTTTLTDRSYYSSASTLPYDNFPGGYYYTGLNLSSSVFQNWIVKYNITAYDQPTFCYIPVPSALDLGSGNVTLTKADYLTGYGSSNPPPPPKNTPFNDFITAFDGNANNQQHISMETRNANWLALKLSHLQQIGSDCSAYCDLSIQGGNSVCTTLDNYINVDPNIQNIITWSSSNTNAATVTPNGNHVTINKVNNGQITLTAVITNDCIQTQTLTKIISVGGPLIGGTYTTNGVQYSLMFYTGGNTYNNSCNLFITTTNMFVIGANSLTWNKISGSIQYTQTGNNISFYFWSINQAAVWSVSASNSCGTTNYNFGWISIDCGPCPFNFNIFPNPATSMVSVIPDIPPHCKGVAGSFAIQQIKIYTNKGNLKKLINYPVKTADAKINVSDLFPGVYYMDVSTGTTSARKTFMIAK